MSDPRISSDWTEDEMLEQVVESNQVLTEEAMREILNGQAELLDRDKVNSMSKVDLYRAVIDRYVQADEEALKKKMNTFDEDIESWVPPGMEQPRKPAQVIDYSHEMPTQYRLDDDINKERIHYGAKHPETGEVIIHMMQDEYVRPARLEGDDECDE